ncbi:hypothetical protein N7457_001181 [Penicillium paradoxum]|uniref:uncharacterized protein n=1 Tax=Penicillium paradoxum TaxID=176176 RepID=UPI00254809E3|nr:uncharacterized protein N7457_001181 [Penicillium paradoxum]KAJ5794582.1 hypothetical protein N7457_001181 [Penicillium paradoxum]
MEDIPSLNATNIPNEEWACISDVEQRRRIQNRVAQRRHRRRIKELKKVTTSSASPVVSTVQSIPTDQFAASQSMSDFPKAAPSPHPQAHSTPSADPSRPLFHTPTNYFPPPALPDVETMLRQWYAQSVPPANAGLGTMPLNPIDGDPISMLQMSQMQLGPDLQKMSSHIPHGMANLADRSRDEPQGGQLGITRPFYPARRSELGRSHELDSSSSDSDDYDGNIEGTRGNRLGSLSAHPARHPLPPTITARDKAHIDRIRRAFRHGMRAGLASPDERASASEDLQRRLVRAMNKVIELYDYGCCLDVIRPDSDLDHMLLALQDQLARVGEMGKIRSGDVHMN